MVLLNGEKGHKIQNISSFFLQVKQLLLPNIVLKPEWMEFSVENHYIKTSAAYCIFTVLHHQGE